MAKSIRLSGREASVVRCIGFGMGVTGVDLLSITQMDPESLVDILNTLLELGYAEAGSLKEQIILEDLQTDRFELNPSYVQELKAVVRR